MNEYDPPNDQVTFLRQLFGDNRAEWSSEKFNQIFVAPTYLSKLKSDRPSFLIGGRGTGKTTALQSLNYFETYSRLTDEGLSFSDQGFLGILVRMNKNRVHAFKAKVLDQQVLDKVFAHYINLLICKELVKMTSWLEDQVELKLPVQDIESISSDLCLTDCSTLDDLQLQIKREISSLQRFVNNPHRGSSNDYSMAESPLRVFVEALKDNNMLGNRTIFCCIDEYENLLDYQQAIINTYIKHAERPLTYKIGVRNYGLRNNQTRDNDDLLKTPDDYGEIQIVEEGFDLFATEVANKRLKFARNRISQLPASIEDFLEDLSIGDEAIKLGAKKISSHVYESIDPNFKNVLSFIKEKPPHEVYFLKYWEEKTGESLTSLAIDWFENQKTWKTRLGNHGYASLFWITKGMKGVRTRKYYSGLTTVLALSGQNIRYFLELIDLAISHQFKNLSELPSNAILSAESQTSSLKDVGRRRLDQLDGVAEDGVKLKRLVLAIGKVFYEMARTPANRSPEVNSFVLSGNNTAIDEISNLLKSGVGHLAFEVSPRTKDTTNVELQDDEYRLHRIFSGFFEISHRKKRRTDFNASLLLDAVAGNPSTAINNLLASQDVSDEEELPEQLAIFSAFYDEQQGKDLKDDR